MNLLVRRSVFKYQSLKLDKVELIVCAAMRKLLHIAFGVLKHKRAFDASLAFSA